MFLSKDHLINNAPVSKDQFHNRDSEFFPTYKD